VAIPLELYVGNRAAEWREAFAGASARARVGSGPLREVSFSPVLVLPHVGTPSGGVRAGRVRSGSDAEGRWGSGRWVPDDRPFAHAAPRRRGLLAARHGRFTTIDRGVSLVYEQVRLTVRTR